MKNIELENRARSFARAAHGAVNQTRKYSGEPYVNHCFEVAEILVKFSGKPVSSAQIAAAYLHDTVEDTAVTLELIRDEFGDEVAGLVENLTDISKPTDGNRKVRKNIDLEHTATGHPDAKSVKLADLISNSHSIVQHDVDFARVYLHEKAKLLDVLTDGDQGLWNEAHRVLVESRRTLDDVLKKRID